MLGFVIVTLTHCRVLLNLIFRTFVLIHLGVNAVLNDAFNPMESFYSYTAELIILRELDFEFLACQELCCVLWLTSYAKFVMNVKSDFVGISRMHVAMCPSNDFSFLY